MIQITCWVTTRKLDFGVGLSSRYESLIKAFMISFLFSATIRLSFFDLKENNSFNPKGTANPTMVLGTIIINRIYKGDKMVLYDVNPPLLLDETVY